PSRGIEALPQMVNFASAFGITVVAAAGDLAATGQKGIPAPASASRAISVGAFDDRNTLTQIDDLIWTNSSVGPRANNGNFDRTDEYKPELSAPGVNIMAARFNSATGTTNGTGTSLAAAHVAGVVACMIQRSTILQRPIPSP